jgi:inorganic pyrophosphatase
VAEKCRERTGRSEITADGDPLDICVLTEKQILRGDLLLAAIPVGGFRMIDGNEADDKIIAVMENDAVYGSYADMRDLPVNLLERLRHYFLTYKDTPGVSTQHTEITHLYGRGEAHDVIRRSQADYQAHYGALQRQAGEH